MTISFHTSDEEKAASEAFSDQNLMSHPDGDLSHPTEYRSRAWFEAGWVFARKYFGGDKARSEEKPSVKNNHPIPDDFIMKGDRMLRYFDFTHLRVPELRATSELFYSLAYELVRTLPASAERTVAFRKLLEAKDAAVRAALDMVNGVS